MPGPEQVVRAAIGLPWAIARRVIGLAAGVLPGFGEDEPIAGPVGDRTVRADDAEVRQAAAQAVERDRDPVEQAAIAVEDEDVHVEPEVELVAESADQGVTEPPGPQLHVEEPWEGYRRMRAAEIVARLEGQPPEVLAAVELYESTHRKRRDVLDAVETASRA